MAKHINKAKPKEIIPEVIQDKKIEEEKQVVEPIKNDVLTTVRQFLYLNEQYNENLIKTLERTYKDLKKAEWEWVNIMIQKKIIFK
jgi:Ni,Fe-hydrogenase III component G